MIGVPTHRAERFHNILVVYWIKKVLEPDLDWFLKTAEVTRREAGRPLVGISLITDAVEIPSPALEASFDRSVRPRPACDAIQGIKNSMNAGTWVANDDRGISEIFPTLPSDTELCGYYNTTKIVMYSTSLSPNEGIAYYEEKLEEMGFTVERKNSIFKGVGYLNARKNGVATVNITFDGNQGFLSFNFTDQR